MEELDYLRDELLPKLLIVQQHLFDVLAEEEMAVVIASLRARIRGLDQVGASDKPAPGHGRLV